MSFFKSCCSTNDAGEPAKKETKADTPVTDADAAKKADEPAAEAVPVEAPVEEAREEAPAEEAPAVEEPAAEGSAAEEAM
jgi:hypothetical protein